MEHEISDLFSVELAIPHKIQSQVGAILLWKGGNEISELKELALAMAKKKLMNLL